MYHIESHIESIIESRIEGNIENHIETHDYIILKRWRVIQGQQKVIKSKGTCSITRLFDKTGFKGNSVNIGEENALVS